MLLAPALCTFLRALSTGAAGVAFEPLALRHQLLVIGSIRRECLNDFIILSQAHLRRLLRTYVTYYDGAVPRQNPVQQRASRSARRPAGRGTRNIRGSRKGSRHAGFAFLRETLTR